MNIKWVILAGLIAIVVVSGCIQEQAASKTSSESTTATSYTPLLAVEEQTEAPVEENCLPGGEFIIHLTGLDGGCETSFCSDLYQLPKRNFCEGAQIYLKLDKNATLRDTIVLTPFDFQEEREIEIVYTMGKTFEECRFVIPESDRKYVENRNLNQICRNIEEIETLLAVNIAKRFSMDVNPYLENAGALYLGNNDLIVWYNQYDWDQAVLHEITHSLTEGINVPAWFDEGLAEYASRTVTERTINTTQTYDDILRWSTSDYGNTRNTFRYNYSAYIIKKFVDDYGIEALQKTIDYLQEHGNDSSNGNTNVLNAMRYATGKPELTLEEVVFY